MIKTESENDMTDHITEEEYLDLLIDNRLEELDKCVNQALGSPAEPTEYELKAVEFYKKYRWLPIESAPFGDDDFLVATEYGYVCHAEFVGNGIYQIELGEHEVYEVVKDWSYWMPVPEVQNDEEYYD